VLSRRRRGRHRRLEVHRFQFNPSFIWIPFGKRKAKDVVFPVAKTFESHGVEFVRAEATSIDPKGEPSRPHHRGTGGRRWRVTSSERIRTEPRSRPGARQVHVYSENVSTDPPTLHRLYGLPNVRDPRVIIVIGQVGNLPDHRSRVLREVNLSLHRVEIVPCDVLAVRAQTILDNVERHLTAS
jgi:hypothetical protein